MDKKQVNNSSVQLDHSVEGFRSTNSTEHSIPCCPFRRLGGLGICQGTEWFTSYFTGRLQSGRIGCVSTATRIILIFPKLSFTNLHGPSGSQCALILVSQSIYVYEKFYSVWCTCLSMYEKERLDSGFCAF